MREDLYCSVNDFCYVFMSKNIQVMSVFSRVLFTMSVPFVIDVDGLTDETIYIVKFRNNSKFDLEKLLILLPSWIKLVLKEN